MGAPAPTDPRLPSSASRCGRRPRATTSRSASRCTPCAARTPRPSSTGRSRPWSGPGRPAGEPVPSGTDLGLDRTLAGQQNLTLLDTRADRAYRPLANVSPELFSRCLCTPLFAVLPRLRFGETRVLQLAFPRLPGHAVPRSTSPCPTSRWCPASPSRRPVRRRSPGARPTWPGRRASRPAVTSARLSPRAAPPRPADRRGRPGRRLPGADLGGVDAELGRRPGPAHPGRAAGVEPAPRRRPRWPPRSRPAARACACRGPRGGATGARWTTATFAGVPTYECLCSGLGLWSRGLRSAGGSAQVTTQVGPLPAGQTRVDVLFPGLEPFRDVPVTRVADPGPLPAEPGTAATWTYETTDPPRGWSTQDWPTPSPRTTRSPTTPAGPSASSPRCPAPDRRRQSATATTPRAARARRGSGARRPRGRRTARRRRRG